MIIFVNSTNYLSIVLCCSKNSRPCKLLTLTPVSIPILSEPDPDTLMSWTQKHPEHWTQNEILDWIYFVASEIEVDPTTIRGEGFQNITGPELCRMDLDDFLRSDPVNGKCFYDMFQGLHKDGKHNYFFIYCLL